MARLYVVSPAQQLVARRPREKRNGRRRGLRRAAETLDRFGSACLGAIQCLLGLAQHHHRRAAMAYRDAEARRQADRLRRNAERRGEHLGAQTLGKHHGVEPEHTQARPPGTRPYLAGPARHSCAAVQRCGWPPGKAVHRRHPRPAASSSGRSRRYRRAPGTSSSGSAARDQSRGTAWKAATRDCRRRSGGRVAHCAGRHRARIQVRAPCAGCAGPGRGATASRRTPRSAG